MEAHSFCRVSGINFMEQIHFTTKEVKTITAASDVPQLFIPITRDTPLATVSQNTPDEIAKYRKYFIKHCFPSNQAKNKFTKELIYFSKNRVSQNI